MCRGLSQCSYFLLQLIKITINDGLSLPHEAGQVVTRPIILFCHNLQLVILHKC
jgi:hypothetical protein